MKRFLLPVTTFLSVPAMALVALLSPPPATELSVQAAAPAEQDALPEGSRPEYDVMESAFCAGCHPAIYAEHQQSTHGRAFTDEEVRLATSRFDLKDCIICHTPRPIFETGIGQNPTRRYHGLEEGNTCMSCHWQPDYDYDSFVGGMQCKDAFHPDVGTVEACASCHRNHGTPYQWEKSPTGKESGRECMDCHMAVVERPVAVGGPVRPVRTHIFPGARSETQVRRAYRYGAEIDGSEVVVAIKNHGAGHNFPTELKQRSVESLVIVRDLEGNEVSRSRRVFRDPYKRPYGLKLPVNTQIPGGETRYHRVPLQVAAGTVETTLFFKQYYPIDDFHPDLSRVLESRTLPFTDIEPSTEEVLTDSEVKFVTPEGIAPEASSPANLVDYARPPIGTVEIDVPQGDTAEDIQALIELFQFPVPEGNTRAQNRLADIGLPAVPALIDALGSWDNKTYKQSMKVLAKIGQPARPLVVEALESDELYVRLHARELISRLYWRGDDVRGSLERALSAPAALDRTSAARTVGRLYLGSMADKLQGLLGDRDPDVVREAALALAKVGAREAAPDIEAALAAAHYPETQRDLATALARLGSTAGVQTLLEGLDYEDDLIRESFFESFFAVTGKHEGYEPLAPRHQRLDGISKLQAWWAVEGGPDKLIPYADDRDPVSERRARDMVAKLGGSDLEAVQNDRDNQLVDELTAMGKYSVPALVSGLKYPSGFASKRALICKVLGNLGDKRAAPALASALRDPVVTVAAWAAWALEGVGDPATLPALRRYEQRVRRLIGTGSVPIEAGTGDALLAQVSRTRLMLGDLAARHGLVSLLVSEDGYARQLAFGALQQRFGEDRGYDPAASAAERRAAAARWAE